MEIETLRQTSDRALRLFLIVGVGLLLALSLQLALMQKINWDEFVYLARIFDFQRGDLTKPLQNLHVQYFGWMTQLKTNSIDTILIGRVIMWIGQAVTTWCIYLISRIFFNQNAALFSALCYLAMAYVLIHGASFRADPLAAALMMICLFLTLRASLNAGQLLLVPILMAVALLITMKVVFYLPAFLAAIVWRAQTSKELIQVLLQVMVVASISVVAFLLLYTWHSAGFPEASIEASHRSATNSANTVFRDLPWFPRQRYLVLNALMTPLPIAILVLGVGCAVCLAVLNRRKRRLALVLLFLAAPLLSTAVYRNAFPYFFPFIFPPVMCLAALVFVTLPNHILLRAPIALAVFLFAVPIWISRQDHDLDHQRTVTLSVHQIFETPVAYIDRSHSIPEFPQRGFFMSTWGLGWYQSLDRPLLVERLNENVVPLLFLNSPTLKDAVAAGGDFESTIIRISIVYAPLRFFFSLAALFALPGLVAIARFLVHFAAGDGSGNIQSLVLASALLAMATVLCAVGILADLIAANRHILEDIRAREMLRYSSAPKAKLENELDAVADDALAPVQR